MRRHHVRTSHSLTPTTAGPRNPEDGITPEVDDALLPWNQTNRVDTWRQLWRSIFPEDKNIPSPSEFRSPGFQVVFVGGFPFFFFFFFFFFSFPRPASGRTN
jgi:hypothetical protein